MLQMMSSNKLSIDSIAFVFKEPHMYRTWRAVAAKKFRGGVEEKEEWSTEL